MRIEGPVVGLGELLWDCFADSKRPGGAPANVAYHAQQLGHRGVICSRIGDDELGRELRKYLEDRGMDTRHIQKDPAKPTGYVTVDATRPNDPSYVIHENVAWDYLEFDAILENLMRNSAAVCFGTLAQRGPLSRETIQRALRAARRALVVYDVNLRQTWYQKNTIEDSMQASNVVKLNLDEVDVLSRLLATGADGPESFAAVLCNRYGLDLICVTRGGKGCLLIGETGTVDEPGVEVDLVDAVGAGDAFTAALISARLRGWSLVTTAWFANRVGALVAGQPGAMPNLKEELGRVVAEAESQSCR